MKQPRRKFLATLATVAAGLAAPMAGGTVRSTKDPSMNDVMPLDPPTIRAIRTAIVLAPGATVIDFAGPWEVFQDVSVRGHFGFRLYTVAADTEPLRATAGLHIIPDFSFADAPPPDLVVVPALRGSAELHEWLAHTAKQADLTMSVCTGAYQLARAGLLDGLEATTHHDFYDDFQHSFPAVRLQRGLRFVEHERIATAGGLTSGIDLALRVVTRYFGYDVAARTAEYMEYTGTGWYQPGKAAADCA